jgi:hypothetical protein
MDITNIAHNAQLQCTFFFIHAKGYLHSTLSAVIFTTFFYISSSTAEPDGWRGREIDENSSMQNICVACLFSKIFLFLLDFYCRLSDNQL